MNNNIGIIQEIKMIPYGKQHIDDEDISEVSETLRSDFLTTGPKVLEFEKRFAEFVGAKYAVAVSNGTAALHLACMAAGLKPYEELITTPMTFAASANCAVYCGANPVFADIKKDYSGLIDPQEIEKKITPKTKVIIPVHYGGTPCDLSEISAIAKENKIIVIEDACHAVGSTYKDSRIGDCKYSDMCVFSFHPVKQLTTGEGGMITTNSEKFYKRLMLYRTHGITKTESEFINTSDGPWYYEMQELGYNYRITDFQCALGLSQMNKIKRFIERRQEIASRYDSFIKDNSATYYHHEMEKDRTSSYHLYVIKLKKNADRLKLFMKMKDNEISPQVHYVPVHLHPFYTKKYGFKRGDFPNAEDFYSRIISVPIYFGLTDEELEKVFKVLE